MNKKKAARTGGLFKRLWYPLRGNFLYLFIDMMKS